MISIFLYHAAIFILLYNIIDAVQNRERMSTWEIIHIGGYMFTVFVTLSYATLVLAEYPEFPFTCEGLYDNSDRIVDTVTYPFEV